MSTPLAELVRQMKEAGNLKHDLEEQLKDANKIFDQLRKIAIPEAMAAIDPDLRQIQIKGFGTLYLRVDLYAGLKDKDQAYQWLTENGYADLIQPQIHPSTLKAWMREQVVDGVTLPDCFKYEPYSYAVITK